MHITPHGLLNLSLYLKGLNSLNSLFCASLMMADRHSSKVHDLFQNRKIDWLYTHSSLAADSGYFRILQQVQSRIYDLDAYLESTWHLSPQKLNEYWTAIEESLDPWHISEKESHTLLRDVHQYQAQELLTRTGGDVTQVPLDLFYYYKTCDVRLIRQLILRKDARIDRLLPTRLWLYFDLITEVEDDLQDQAEDQHTFNVNRYMAALRLNNLENVHQTYRTFVDDCYHRANGEAASLDFPWKAHYLEWIRESWQRLSVLGLSA